MKTISYREAMLRARYTEHGLALLEVVERQPGIQLETLIREHDPAPPRLVAAFQDRVADPSAQTVVSSPAAPKKALRRFPRGGHAVKQLCDAGALVITEDLRVYLPKDLPPKDLPARSDGNSSDDHQESDRARSKKATEGRRASA